MNTPSLVKSAVVVALALGTSLPVLFASLPDLTVNYSQTECSSCAGAGGPFRVFDTFSLGSAATVDQCKWTFLLASSQRAWKLMCLV